MWQLILFSLLVKLVNCKLDLNAYNFGKNGGSIIYNYEENIDTKLDSIELSFMTYTFNCTLIHISSAISTDHITIRLNNGIPVANYNLGLLTHQITFKKPIRINDGNYHKLRFNRFGQNSTLQLDSNWTINLHPKSKSNIRPFTVFNAHSHIRLGGIDNQQYLNYELDSYLSDNDDQSNDNNQIVNNNLKRTNHFILSNQIVNYDHFVGVMLNVIVNGYSILDMAAADNSNVIVSGDVHLLLSLPRSSIHKLIHNYHHKINKTSNYNRKYQQLIKKFHQLDSQESNYLNHHKAIHHNKPNKHKALDAKDLLEMMQGDQPTYDNHHRGKAIKNKLVKVNKKENNQQQQQQNYEGDDLIFTGSGCFDDEDECANYADAGSGSYDDLITPVYVSIKPTPKSNSKSNKNNKQTSNKRNGSKCTPIQEDQLNRPTRPEDDDNEEDDDDDEDCGSGDDSPAGSNSEETTERSADNNNDHLYQLSTEQSNINPVTIDDDRTMTDLYTSKPIPPPESEVEKIIETTTRRPLPPKKTGGHIEIVMLPLPPSETATPKTNFNNFNKNVNRDNKKLSGIQITGGLSPNDINNLEDDLDSNFDSSGNLNQYGSSNRDSSSLSENGNEILGGAIPISINKNLIDFKFNKNSADRTALLIAAVAILVLIIVIIAPIVVFIKMRLKNRNIKLGGIPITTQLSPAYQQTNKTYASLSAIPPPSINSCNPVAFATNNPNYASMHHLALNTTMQPNITTNPYGTIESKAPKLPSKKDLGKEWYV